MDNHPSTKELAAFAAGELDDGDMDRIGEHVTNCSRCTERLEAISPLFDLPGSSDTPAKTTIAEDADARSRLGLESTFHTAPPAPRPLTTVPALPKHFGRYEIRKKLGEGGMGAVYLAHDTQLDRRVALKVPSFAANDPQEIIDRFYREAQAMAALQHANLCPVFDVGEIGGIHYLTMAFLEGRPLSDYLKGKPQPCRQAATIIRKLARALQSAHEVGIVHRDLKPANVIVKTDHEPVITDFGLSLDAGKARLTNGGMVLGTPAYMSPEQVDGNKKLIGPATDLYALGVILYQMLTGELPYQGSLQTVLFKILAGRPEPPQLANPEVDSGLQAICLKCMASRVDDRYESARALALDLGKFLKGERPAALKTAPPSNRYDFTVTCDVCGTRSDVNSDLIGRHLRCPDCHTSFQVQAPDPQTRRAPIQQGGEEFSLTPPSSVRIRAAEAKRMLAQAEVELNEESAEASLLPANAGDSVKSLLATAWQHVLQAVANFRRRP